MLTDVEGSTELWEWDRCAMSEANAIHDRIMRSQLAKFCGYEVCRIVHQRTCLRLALSSGDAVQGQVCLLNASLAFLLIQISLYINLPSFGIRLTIMLFALELHPLACMFISHNYNQ